MTKTKINLQELQTPINFAALAEGVTPSEIQCYHDCHEKWYRGYNQLLKLKKPVPWALTFGSAFHKHQEQWFASNCTKAAWDLNPPTDPTAPNDWQSEGEKWDIIGKAQTDAYKIHYKNDAKHFKFNEIEHKIELVYDGHKMRGMIDMMVEERAAKYHLVWDTKTAGRLDESVTSGFKVRMQFRYYDFFGRLIWPKRKIFGFMPDVIKKPQIKQCQNESLEAFAWRVQRDMLDRPQMYFYREKHEVTPESLARFEHNFLRPALDAFSLIRKAAKNDDQQTLRALARQKNSGACVKYGEKYKCEFYELCHNEGQEGLYETKANKHSELDDEEE